MSHVSTLNTQTQELPADRAEAAEDGAGPWIRRAAVAGARHATAVEALTVGVLLALVAQSAIPLEACAACTEPFWPKQGRRHSQGRGGDAVTFEALQAIALCQLLGSVKESFMKQCGDVVRVGNLGRREIHLHVAVQSFTQRLHVHVCLRVVRQRDVDVGRDAFDAIDLVVRQLQALQRALQGYRAIVMIVLTVHGYVAQAALL